MRPLLFSSGNHPCLLLVGRAGKIDGRYRMPAKFEQNRADRLDRVLEPYRARSLFPAFPFGTDLTREEIGLRQALQHLNQMTTFKRPARMQLRHVMTAAGVPASARPYLERMRLDAPSLLKSIYSSGRSSMGWSRRM
jgi:hypothetical protein